MHGYPHPPHNQPGQHQGSNSYVLNRPGYTGGHGGPPWNQLPFGEFQFPHPQYPPQYQSQAFAGFGSPYPHFLGAQGGFPGQFGPPGGHPASSPTLVGETPKQSHAVPHKQADGKPVPGPTITRPACTIGAPPLKGYFYSKKTVHINVIENFAVWEVPKIRLPCTCPKKGKTPKENCRCPKKRVPVLNKVPRFQFQTWKVPANTTIRELLDRFGGGEGAFSEKVLTEVHEAGNGIWRKGITFPATSLDIDRPIQDFGWTERRQDQNPVWLCVMRMKPKEK